MHVRGNRSRSYRSTPHTKGKLNCASYGDCVHRVQPSFFYAYVDEQDAGSQQIGFLLGSCSVSVALTSEACLKGLPKTTAGDVISFKGWPKLHWVVTEHLPRPPKDWSPAPKLTDDTPAYIEVRSSVTVYQLDRGKNETKVLISFSVFYRQRRIRDGGDC